MVLPHWCKAKQSSLFSEGQWASSVLLCDILEGHCVLQRRGTGIFGFKTDYILCCFLFFFPDYVSSPLCTHVLWYSHLISMWWTCIHISFYKTTQICLTRVFIHDVSCSCVLIDRHMMERTRHPVSLATLHVMAWWVISSTVHPIACGLSSTAMPLEQVRASASHTQVSCLRIFWLIRNVEIQFFSPLHL